MSMARLIQDAWNKQATWLIILRPLACLYRGGFLINRWFYQTGLKKVYHSPVPVMVIGNITVGGSGKTPLLIHLVKYLQSKQVRVGVISRGYGGKGPFPAQVSVHSTPEQVGDEPCLIVQSTGIPMAVGSNRQANIELLLQHHSLDLIISDDGLQHWALGRQIEWVVLDNNRGLGNEKLLPEGYLREPKSRLQKATVIEHAQHPQSVFNMHLEPGQPYLLNPGAGKEQRFDATLEFHAVVGIGFPERFYQTLASLGINRIYHHAYADHHNYQLKDLEFGDLKPLITTEKDAVKIRQLLKSVPEFKRQIWVVPVDAILSSACYALLEQQLGQYDIQIS